LCPDYCRATLAKFPIKLVFRADAHASDTGDSTTVVDRVSI
jgi:hypothetical protein